MIPYQVGAISTVLRTGRAEGEQHTVTQLLSDKSSLGHAEPAAGVCSLALAITVLARQDLQPVHHLRLLNPMVHEHGRLDNMGHTQLKPPRQCAPMSAQPASTVHASSFAFVGTNAHVMLRRGASSGHKAISSSQTHLWESGSHWAKPMCSFPLRSTEISVSGLTTKLTLSASYFKPEHAPIATLQVTIAMALFLCSSRSMRWHMI